MVLEKLCTYSRYVVLILLLVPFGNLDGLSQELYGVDRIPKELLEDANSVVRDYRRTVNIENPKMLTIDVFTAITVLNKNGDYHIDPYVNYDESTKVRDVEIIIYDERGKETEKIKKRDFIDVSAVDGFSLYTDNRKLVADFSPSGYPYTIAMKYTVTSSNTAFIGTFYPISYYNSSVERSSCKVSFVPGIKFRYSISDPTDAITMSKSPDGMRWSAENLAALESEAHSPRFEEFAPHVLFTLDEFYLEGVAGRGENWEQFGKWMNQSLLAGVSDLPEGTKAQIRSLVANETDLEARARKVYQYVQDRTRYISVQIGIGGWKPMLAEDVDKLGYGDCKGLTNYTKALLEVAEVPSYYTVVNAGDDKRDIESDFTSMQGNHAILAVPNGDDYFWLECTSQDAPFGFIAGATDDRDVLVITPEGGKIVHTKEYTHEESRLITKGVVNLSAAGNINAEVTMESTGLQYRGKNILEKSKQEEIDEYYKEYWDYINNMALGSISFDNNREEARITETISFAANRYASSAGDKLIVNVNALNRVTYIPKKYKNRMQPLVINRGFEDVDEVIMKLPEGLKLETVPEPIELTSEFGRYTSSISVLEDGSLKYNRSFELYEGTHDKESYDTFRNFWKKVSKSDNQKIILSKQ